MNDTEDQSPTSTKLVESNCPYVGLSGDRETRYGFPTNGNRCHRLTPAAEISLEYQENWCLSENFKGCPVFQNPIRDNLPEGVTLHRRGAKISQNALLAMILAATLLALVATFILLQTLFLSNKNGEIGSATLTAAALSYLATNSNEAQMPVPLSETPAPSPSPTLTPSPSSTLTPEPTMTFTPELPTFGPDLETPFGPGAEFVLHKVKPGESARSIAYEYRTTYAVITSTNVLLPGGSLLVDMVLFIIPGIKENLGLPIFRPLYMDQDESVSAIAEIYGISQDDLRRYNSLGMGDRISAGRWIIIPLPTQTSP